jgi:hypothetical protein
MDSLLHGMEPLAADPQVAHSDESGHMGPPAQVSTQAEQPVAEELSLDEIIAELESPGRLLPERALREAQRRRDEVTPRLIELIRVATQAVRDGGDPEGNGHFFALFLLGEFRANEALPAILEAISVPDDEPIALFGDAITECLSQILAGLTADAPHVLDELLAKDSLGLYVRLAAVEALQLLVRDGRLTRGQAVEWLRQRLRQAIEWEDSDLCTGLVLALETYAPLEAVGEIDAAFARGLVDEYYVTREEIDQSVAGGDAHFRTQLEQCRPTGIQDTVEELRTWEAWSEGDWEESDDDWDDDLADEEDFEYEDDYDLNDLGAERDDFLGGPGGQESITIRRTAPRVGRNDPCPCGSGKKYKKCCGES